MERVSVFVDAGYLFAAGGLLLAGTKVGRSALELNHAKIVDTLKAAAHEASGLPLLRIYWYDGTDSGPSPQHTALAFQDEIKVRLGIVNRFGEQKGVDSLLVTDMINLARNRAMASALLVTGDEDIRVGVQQAQEHGVRVHLIGIAPARSNQSNLLLQEADTTAEWDQTLLSTFLSVRPSLPIPKPVVPLSGDLEDVMEEVIEAVLSALDEPTVQELKTSFARGELRIPPEVDRLLLKTLPDDVTPIDWEQKHRMRELFRERAQEWTGPPESAF